MFYASEDKNASSSDAADANTYRPFRTIDSTVMSRVMDEFDALGQLSEEGELRFLYSYLC